MRFRASIRGGCGRLIASFCRSCVRSPGKRGSGALRACGRDGGESRGQRLAAGVTKSLLAACNHHASFPPRRRRFANGCVPAGSLLKNAAEPARSGKDGRALVLPGIADCGKGRAGRGSTVERGELEGVVTPEEVHPTARGPSLAGRGQRSEKPKAVGGRDH